jgi:hypothetical protein
MCSNPAYDEPGGIKPDLKDLEDEMHNPTPLPAVIASEQFRGRSRAGETALGSDGGTRDLPLRAVAARYLAVLVTAISAVVLAAAAVFTGPSASAHTATIATQHSFAVSSGVPSGQLSSSVPACLSGRTITLYRIGVAGPNVVTTTSTTSAGAWTRSALTLSGGDYYAVAAAKVIRTSGHKHTCASAKSNTVAVAVDADRDGYPLPGDCQDADPTINPGAAEVRNGVDDDCDGFIDEGLDHEGVDPCPTAEQTWLDGQSYCSGTIAGVVYGSYGVGTRLVLQGVSVYAISGATVSVAGGPSCPPSDEPVYCGATIPSFDVDASTADALPELGQIVDVYGVTGTKPTFNATSFVWTGYCDPDVALPC